MTKKMAGLVRLEAKLNGLLSSVSSEQGQRLYFTSHLLSLFKSSAGVRIVGEKV